MKTVFIINKKAGNGKNIDKLVEAINASSMKLKKDIEIYFTKSVGDAKNYVSQYCKKFGGARFIACGGDGTLSEVLNGAIECREAEIGVVPIGSGNDFCRNFGKECDFKNTDFQISSESVKCDVIKYTTSFEGQAKTGYCVNMTNIGFDCNVVDITERVREKTILSGALAYFFSIFITLVKKKGANLKIEIDGKIKHNGKLLLTSLANGSYCGGGIKSNPLADVSDGLININIVKDVPRIKFIRLLPYYMKGTFLKLKNIENIATSQKCKNVTITNLDKNLRICIDGEITDVGKTDFSIEHEAFKFVLPLKIDLIHKKIIENV